MSFAAPLFLLLLLLIPLGVLVAVALQRRRRRYAVRFPAVATVAAVGMQAPRWRRWLPGALLAAAVAALVLALARPETTVAVPVERASVVLIMDTSRSMLADDVDPTRLEAAKRAAVRFLERVPEELRVGLVAYSTGPHTVIDPTEEREDLRLTLESLIPDGGTATGDALRVAIDRIDQQADEEGRRPPAAIVLLSDGKSTDGVDPIVAAREAGDRDLPVYTIAFGTPAGVVSGGPFQPPIPVPPDPETLHEMAEVSGGQAFEVEDAAELDRVYERLGSQVGSEPEQREITAGFAAVGLAFLLAAAAAGMRWRSALA